MSNKYHPWLRSQIAQWQSEGLLSEALASQLRERYPDTQRAWGRFILSALGGILIGLGVILFFAYNWADMPKTVKLGIVFFALFASHGGALWLSTRSSNHQSAVEGLHVLGTILFGAGIWLIAQIYHIDEHYPNALLVWWLAALALAWAMPSLTQAFVALLLMGLWTGFETLDFDAGNQWAPLLVVFGVLPLAWIHRSRVLLFFSLYVLLIMTMLACLDVDDDLIVAVTFYLCALYIVIGAVVDPTKVFESDRVLKFVGFSGYLIALYVFSFEEGSELVWGGNLDDLAKMTYYGLPIISLIGFCIAAMTVFRSRLDWFWLWQCALIAVATAITLAAQLGWIQQGWPIAILMNFIFLGHCVCFILKGSQVGQAKLVAIACLLLSALVLTRYVDLFDSLLLRSLVFLSLGIGLFFVGNFYSRLRHAESGVNA